MFSIIHKHKKNVLILFTFLMSCAAPERLTVDDTNIETSAKLIQERRLSDVSLFKKSPPLPLPPRRKVMGIYYNPLSFQDTAFQAALERRYLSEHALLTPENDIEISISSSANSASDARYDDAVTSDTRSKADVRHFLESSWKIIDNQTDVLDQKLTALENRLAEISQAQTHIPLTEYSELSAIVRRDNRIFALQAREQPLTDLLELLSAVSGYSVQLHHEARTHPAVLSVHRTGTISDILTHIAQMTTLSLAETSLSTNERPDLILLPSHVFSENRKLVHLNTRTQNEYRRLRWQITETSRAHHQLVSIHRQLGTMNSEYFMQDDDVRISVFDTDFAAPALPAMFQIQALYHQLEQSITERQALEQENKLQTKTSAELRHYWKDILRVSDCIDIGGELFVEQVALYHRTAVDVVTALESFFSPSQAFQPIPASHCLASDTAQSQFTARPHQASVIISGQHSDIELAVRLIESFDQPKLQVLVEIFMVTVSRGFSRQLENIITRASDPGAGGNNVTEAELLRSISSVVTGGYTANLSTASNQIQSALSFIESQELGRVLSSPTILVQDGTKEARIRRQTTAEVLLTQNIFDDNSSRVVGTEEVNTQLEAPLELLLKDITVSPANQTVEMTVRITNKEFLSALGQISKKEDADFTEDVIETVFTASPGDVIVLAGLTANKDSTSSAGLPGTTGADTALPALLGGSDIRTNLSNEMVVFLAPTVIDPSSELQDQKSARRLNALSVQEKPHE